MIKISVTMGGIFTQVSLTNPHEFYDSHAVKRVRVAACMCAHACNGCL